MKLINQAKTKFLTSKGIFKINSIVDFGDEEGRTLLKYEGINSVESLEDKKPSKSEYELLKEEATKLGLEFPGNISKADLIDLIEESK